MADKTVPAHALHFQSGDITIAESTPTEGAATTYDVSLLARSSGPIEHWYWGQQTVHDFSGMRVAEKIPIDFNHDTAEVIGYLDSFTQEADGLRVNGKLVSFNDNDRAAEIAKKAKAGIPWQASINFGGDGITVEKLSENSTTTVNNRQLAGPATIIRTFPLRGVAITPYGADDATESVVLSGTTKVSVNFEETNMAEMQTIEEEVLDSETTAEELEDAAIAEQDDEQQEISDTEKDDETDSPAELASEPVVLSQADGQRFVELFGQQGAIWFIEGKTEAECFSLHVETLQAEVASLSEENQKLHALVDSAETGEEAPLAFSNGQAPVSPLQARAKELQSQGIQNENVAKMTAMIEKQLQ